MRRAEGAVDLVHSKTSSREVALIVQAWRKRTQMARPDDATRPKAGVSRDEIQDLFHQDLYNDLVRQNALSPAAQRPETRQAKPELKVETPQTETASFIQIARRNRLAALMARNLKRMLIAAEPVTRSEPLLLTNIVRIGIANLNTAPDGTLPDPRRLHLTMAG